MIGFILVSILYTAYAQYNCSAAANFNLPSYHKNLAFNKDTPASKAALQAGSVSDVYGYYFKYTPRDGQAGLNINLNTCAASTTLTTDIYLFKTCTEEGVAEDFVASSGLDNLCEKSNEFPIIYTTTEVGVTYYVLVKKKNKGDEGNVDFNVAEDFSVNDHIECDVAREIESLPYINQGQIFEKDVPQIVVNGITTPSSALWYKWKGDGKFVQINTCDSYTNFDTRIILVNETVDGKCNGANTVKIANDGCGRTSDSAILTFQSVADVVYYIGVFAVPGSEGQFELRMDYLSDSVPSVCSKALPIKALPFSRTTQIVDAWPTTTPSCNNFQIQVRAMYLTLVGDGRTMVISTCKSLDSELNTVGAQVDLIDNCVDEKCIVNTDDTKEFGYCGENNYIVATLQKDKTYFIKAFCVAGPCDLTLNVYEKVESHDTCEHAMKLSNPGVYSEVVVTQNQEDSVHGCNELEMHKGLWYNFMHTKSISNEYYLIYAMNAMRSKTGYIEFPNKCSIVGCSAETQQGEAYLMFDSMSTSQLLFIYHKNVTENKGLIVQFVSQDVQLFYTCDNALPIELPYTALHSFSNIGTVQLCNSGITAPANYYKFRLENDNAVTVSTCFAKTVVNTALEITKGCYGDRNTECITSVTDGGVGCSYGAVKTSVDLKAETDYILSIYSEQESQSSIKQYRVVMFSHEIPENSVCTSAIKLRYQDGYAKYLMLNRLGYKTSFGEQGEAIGNWYYLSTPKQYDITIRTCSSSTTMNSMISVYKDCAVEDQDGKPLSVPTQLFGKALASSANCDVYGTYLTFTTEVDVNYYIYVGPERFDEEGFIDVQFFMNSLEEPDDEPEPEPEPEPTPDPEPEPTPSPSSSAPNDSDNNAEDVHEVSIPWVIAGSVIYLYAIVLAVVTVFVVMIDRRTHGYSAFD